LQIAIFDTDAAVNVFSVAKQADQIRGKPLHHLDAAFGHHTSKRISLLLKSSLNRPLEVLETGGVELTGASIE